LFKGRHRDAASKEQLSVHKVFLSHLVSLDILPRGGELSAEDGKDAQRRKKK
jgi:hypothetical protein